jgi:molecular chaperone GrpE
MNEVAHMTEEHLLENSVAELLVNPMLESTSPIDHTSTDKTQSIQQALAQVSCVVSELKADFESKIKYDESKDRTINLLHQELQDYRNDLNLQYLRPLAMEFVALYDNMAKIAESYRADSTDYSSESIVQKLDESLQDIEDGLSRHGFEIYQAESEQVDRSLQHVQKTLPTNNPDRDRQVATRLRKGLRYGERILRPEGVIAYRYAEPSSTTSEEA